MKQQENGTAAKSYDELVAETRARRTYLTDEMKKLEAVEKALRVKRRGRPRKAANRG